MTEPDTPKFVSRAGLKLHHALDEFHINPTGWICADFGCNIGGFTDCLLQHGAARMYAIDTGYGMLDYRLRIHPQVVVMERTNALHVSAPELVDLVVIDLAWTRQQHSIPAALKWLKPSSSSDFRELKADGSPPLIISLVKPHYEILDSEKPLLNQGFLPHEHAHIVFQRVLENYPTLGVTPVVHAQSPLTGGKTSRKKNVPGNIEFLVLLKPV
ncbi:MAG TPA: SAM-dependent methyltransferase [Phycisphaerales bacterium]|nr:SAM-dependent methyltransferase [Phycisphaerales bacterium]